jgi:DNA-binding transcriptional ArsR family regulator
MAACWCRRGFRAPACWVIRPHGSVLVPPGFPRASVSQLMWQYALRTQADLLPPHYRTQPLYFRRAPRLKHRQLRDAHLLLLRELDAHPGMTFYQLQESTGMGAESLGRHLSALYVVGSITSNRLRAVGGAGRKGTEDSRPAGSSMFLSEMDPAVIAEAMRRPPAEDRTVPAPLMPDRTVPAPLMPDRD